jgi:hypothetical protein
VEGWDHSIDGHCLLHQAPPLITLHGGSFVAICFGLLGGVITQCGGHRLLWQEKENKRKEKGKRTSTRKRKEREDNLKDK